MAVRRFVVFALLGLGLGFAALSWRSSDTGRDRPVSADAGAARAPLPTARSAPPELATEPSGAPSTAPANRADEPLEDEETGVEPSAEPARDRIALLIAAGFSPDRAAHIVRRESELRVAAASEEYAATGTVRALTGSVQNASAAKLREEIGDAEFERYLDALGQPTSVVIGSIDPASAAANAGLLPGDEIVAYGGQRVFNARDLSVLSLQRGTGETVGATVVRDGQALQLYVTGGPLGLVPATR